MIPFKLPGAFRNGFNGYQRWGTVTGCSFGRCDLGRGWSSDRSKDWIVGVIVKLWGITVNNHYLEERFMIVIILYNTWYELDNIAKVNNTTELIRKTIAICTLENAQDKMCRMFEE